MNLDNTFTHHPPTGNQAERYVFLRAEAKRLAEAIVTNTPASAEQTLALRAVQQAMMWANAAIAINENAS